MARNVCLFIGLILALSVATLRVQAQETTPDIHCYPPAKYGCENGNVCFWLQPQWQTVVLNAWTCQGSTVKYVAPCTSSRTSNCCVLPNYPDCYTASCPCLFHE